MILDSRICYRALKARDARFDGRFFVAVSSTRIYCRPVCTVKPPKRGNCRFFPSAAAAESSGYRPCLRCRPELAPGNASVDATTRLAQAAASMMEDRTLDKEGLDTLAVRLGITDRHLRRAFGAEFGVSPVEFAQTRRVEQHHGNKLQAHVSKRGQQRESRHYSRTSRTESEMNTLVDQVAMLREEGVTRRGAGR
jgi:AraC family transcriptional regulator, regulatory protein of adaptative response / DNA-3-methyladenine glycosylase II